MMAGHAVGHERRAHPAAAGLPAGSLGWRALAGLLLQRRAQLALLLLPPLQGRQMERAEAARCCSPPHPLAARPRQMETAAAVHCWQCWRPLPALPLLLGRPQMGWVAAERCC